MKHFITITTAVLLSLISKVYAQGNSHFHLTSGKPQAGKIVSFTYNPAGTMLGHRVPEAIVCFLDNKNFPTEDIQLNQTGNLFKGAFRVPKKATAFFIRFTAGGLSDNNGEKGYAYLVYHKNVPVPGAYAGLAYATGLGADFSGIKKDMKASANLYKREFVKHPGLEKDYERLFLLTLSYSDAGGQYFADQRAAELARGKSEHQLIEAYNYFKHARRNATADSLLKVILTNYPNGGQALNMLIVRFETEPGADAKDTIFQKVLAAQPNNKNGNDYCRQELALAYLSEGNFKRFDALFPNVKNVPGFADGLSDQLATWAEQKKYPEETALIADKALGFLKNPNAVPVPFLSPKQVAAQRRDLYYHVLQTAARNLYNEGKIKEAIEKEGQVYLAVTNAGLEAIGLYASMLNSNNDFIKAKAVLEKGYAAGVKSKELDSILKMNYTDRLGNGLRFAQYLDSLRQLADFNEQDNLVKNITKVAAPSFKLNDINGKPVSFADLKGKVIILDFWATWCAPCKASFPAMQKTIDLFKDNPNVVFLFVDTWENTGNYKNEVKKYLSDSKYSFTVLFDEKGLDGKQSRLRNLYGVVSVPTKFIIDKTGNIIFRVEGYSGPEDRLINELSSEIEIAGELPTIHSQASK